MYLKKVGNKQKITFCSHLEGYCLKEQDSDPLVRGTDPELNVTDLEHWFFQL
jgi:hypothetical protein